jgi:hypothetical protein
MPYNSFKKLIDLAKLGGNKFFVLDESGEPQLVIMGVDEYEKILVKKIENQLSDIEAINNKIIEAQKQDISENEATAATRRKREEQEQLKSEVIDSTFSFEPNNFNQGAAHSTSSAPAELPDEF